MISMLYSEPIEMLKTQSGGGRLVAMVIITVVENAVGDPGTGRFVLHKKPQAYLSFLAPTRAVLSITLTFNVAYVAHV